MKMRMIVVSMQAIALSLFFIVLISIAIGTMLPLGECASAIHCAVHNAQLLCWSIGPVDARKACIGPCVVAGAYAAVID